MMKNLPMINKNKSTQQRRRRKRYQIEGPKCKQASKQANKQNKQI